ncbi:MAG: ABC transporter substrate-binding protein [Betaproteobacteria bacterium]|nr:ABC transporter substrate-binding protein [Betaproteobacteria bacterium]
MERRDTLLLLIALGAPLRLTAQSALKVPRIGVLIVGTSESSGHVVQAFIKGMTELGYQDGKNVRYELRYGDGSSEQAERNARELVAAKADLIWAPSTVAATEAQKATLSLPIVFALSADPVAAGLIRSLPRPGTNASGISLMSAEMGAKRVEILTETFPKLRRVGVLHNPGDSASAAQLPFVRQGVRAFSKELMVVEARAPEEFATALAKLAAWRVDALVIMESVLYFAHRKTLMDKVANYRWPTITNSKEYAEAGGILAYGTDFADNCRRSAVYVDKILKGAKPGDLPVQQPTTFEFVINLKAAKAMGLAIPKAMLLRADRVIE